jgi:hypothetical protein
LASNCCAIRNVLIVDGLIKIALAEAEARAGDGARAVPISGGDAFPRQ